jgi:cyanate permease
MLFTITQTLAGPRAAGQWTGLQNFCGNLAGILGPVLTGMLVDRTGTFASAFFVTAGISLTAALAFGVIVPQIEPVAWPARDPGARPAPQPASA